MRTIELTPAAAAAELAWSADSAAPHFAQVFGRVAPVEVDLGCGDGAFLTQLAARHPERNFLGVERLIGRSGGACRRIARLGLTNARIWRGDIPVALQQLFAPQSVAVFNLMFPDPWPKRRHQVRRVFRPDLLQLISRALTANGLLRVATDDVAYFEEMQRVLDRVAAFEACSERKAEEFPPSTFEQRFLKRGLEIHRAVLRKVSDVR